MEANDVFIFLENLTDEERIWEEIHEIKMMTVPMSQKKEFKAQLQSGNSILLYET